MFGPPQEQKPAWEPPRWALPLLIIIGPVWGYIEIVYAQSYFFGGAALFLSALAGYELYKMKRLGSSADDGLENPDEPDTH